MGDEVSLVTKNAANKVALLDGDKATSKHDLLTGLFPYNIAVAPSGAIALTADNGNNGTSDGNADTVSVIDLTAPVHVIDHVTVPDSPEGMAFSPKGNLAVSADALGSNHGKQDWYYHQHGVVTVLKVSGKKVTKLDDIEGGSLAGGSVLYTRRQVSLCRQLYRPGFFHFARQRNQSHRYGQALQGAGPPGLGPHEPALTPIVG